MKHAHMYELKALHEMMLRLIIYLRWRVFDNFGDVIIVVIVFFFWCVLKTNWNYLWSDLFDENKQINIDDDLFLHNIHILLDTIHETELEKKDAHYYHHFHKIRLLDIVFECLSVAWCCCFFSSIP